MKTETKLTDLKGITVTVTIPKIFYVRLFVAKWLIRLGAWVAGCGIEFDDDELEAQ